VRATDGSALSAAARVSALSAAAAIAKTNSAASFFGARPLVLMSTTRCTTRVPSSAIHAWTATAFSFVSWRSRM
jgi:hypothetical protein